MEIKKRIYTLKSFPKNGLIKTLKSLYEDILNYNKNVYPIIGYDVYNPSNIYEIVNGLQTQCHFFFRRRVLPPGL